MATDAGSAASKGKRAGKRGQPPPTSDASRGIKQEPSEVEDNVFSSPGPPSSKKRRTGVEMPERKLPIYAPPGSTPKPPRVASKIQPKNRTAIKQENTASSLPQTSGHTNNANKTGEEWSTEDLTRLIEGLLSALPKSDSVKYSTQAERIDWNKLRFGSHSAEECKEKWSVIMTKLRRYRTLTELALDAKEWVKHPWMTYSNTKSKPKHPDLPKKPLTPYFRYFLEKREKYSKDNPDMSMTELAKLLAKKFAELPDKKKQKYKDSYERENALYKNQMEKFRVEHPDMFPEVEAKTKTPQKQNGPQKPQTPLQLFLADKMIKHLGESGATKKEMEEKYKLQWKNLADSKRVRWIKKAMADNQRYATDLTEYCVLHPEYKPDQIKPAISKAEKEMKDRSDGKPERPPNSGYSLYSKIMLKELKDIPSKEKMAEISRRWKDLSEKERQGYARQALEALERYQQDFKLYIANLPEEDRKKAEEDMKKKKRAPSNAQSSSAQLAKVTTHDLNELTPSKPKKPMSALFLYQQEKLAQYKSRQPDRSEQELTRSIAREYNELSEKKKEKYKKMAEDAKKTYEQATTTKEIEVKNKVFKGEPKKPPVSGYSLFTSEMMSKLPNIEPKYRMAEISKRWGTMTIAEKEKYRKRAADLQKKFAKEHTKFLATLTEEEQRLYAQMKAKKPVRRKVTPTKAKVEPKSSSSSEDESSKEEDNKQDGDEDDEDSSSSASGSGSGSDSDSSSGSEESGSESGSGSDSDSDGSDSDKDKEENDSNAGDDKEEKDSGDSSSDGSGSGTDSGSGSESESEEE